MVLSSSPNRNTTQREASSELNWLASSRNSNTFRSNLQLPCRRPHSLSTAIMLVCGLVFCNEKACQLYSLGSQVELAEELEMGFALSPASFARFGALRPDQDAHLVTSSNLAECMLLTCSIYEELDVMGINQ
ncbi:hypothetical protein Q8A67_018889 [Cirrhinus molitorella]|uniref:Uncharacterized protein n=1 Tax=Cirrhinus molitorella TaxID=172907 RepID=A0AA88TF62_9TELE|nr:hypothetical protein Q8A67_018889 [Cirrhinus molitorella]